MDDDEHAARGLLAAAEALDAGMTDSGARIKAVEEIRRHAMAILNRSKANRDENGSENDDG